LWCDRRIEHNRHGAPEKTGALLRHEKSKASGYIAGFFDEARTHRPSLKWWKPGKIPCGAACKARDAGRAAFVSPAPFPQELRRRGLRPPGSLAIFSTSAVSLILLEAPSGCGRRPDRFAHVGGIGKMFTDS
jgi:hypothetical protein